MELGPLDGENRRRVQAPAERAAVELGLPSLGSDAVTMEAEPERVRLGHRWCCMGIARKSMNR
jgi:hypothetical protein